MVDCIIRFPIRVERGIGILLSRFRSRKVWRWLKRADFIKVMIVRWNMRVESRMIAYWKCPWRWQSKVTMGFSLFVCVGCGAEVSENRTDLFIEVESFDVDALNVKFADIVHCFRIDLLLVFICYIFWYRKTFVRRFIPIWSISASNYCVPQFHPSLFDISFGF